MFTYILSDKRKPVAFKAENITQEEVLFLLLDALSTIRFSELSSYTFIIIDEEDDSILRLKGGDYLEKVLG